MGSKKANYSFRLYSKSPIFEGFIPHDLTYPPDLTMFRGLARKNLAIFRFGTQNIRE